MPDKPKLEIDCSRQELDGFVNYYKEEILPELEKLQEPQTLAIRRYYHMLAAGLLVFIIITSGYMYFDLRLHQAWGGYFYIIPIVYLVIAIFGPTIPLSKIQSNVKGLLLTKTSNFLGLKYNPVPNNFPEALLNESGLFPKYHSQYLKDGFKGNYKGVEFAYAECTLNKRKGSGDNETYSKVYQGILLLLTLKNPFTGRIIISRNASLISNFINQFKQPPRVVLDHKSFEETFNVYATEEEEARSLLTNEYLETLFALDKSVSPDFIEVSYFDNYMLLSIHSTKNRFVTQGIFHPVSDPTNIKEMIKEICLIYDLIDLLLESPWAEEKWGPK